MLNLFKMPISRFGIKQGTFNPLKISSFLGFHHSSTNPNTIPSKYIHWYAFEDIKNIDDAVKLFDKMLQTKPIPPIDKFSRLFNIIVKMKHYSHVILMYKKLSLLGCNVDGYIMSTVINCYCNLGNVELGFAILASFIKIGYAPNIVSITCMIKWFFIQDSVGKAVELFKKVLRDDLCKVNEFTVSVVLDGLSKSGNIVEAVKLLDILERKGYNLNVVVYTAVLDGLCKARMVERAMGLLLNMIDRGILPDVVTYTSFIYGLCKKNRVDDARGFFNDLPSKGICPNVITYTVMIQGLCQKGLFQDVEEMVEKMERIGCLPNSVTCNVIIYGCLKNHDGCYSINLLKQIVGRDFQLNAGNFFLLLRQMQALRQMQGIYDDGDFIKSLTQKLISSDTRPQMQESNVDVVINSLMQKLTSIDSR